MRHVHIARCKRKAVPFSAYGYNIANVPQNSIVLALPEFATLPSASSMVGRMVRNTTDGKVYESRKVLNNAGTDTLSLGRPSNIINLIDVAKAFTITAVFSLTDLDAQAVIFGNEADTFGNRTLLRINNSVGDRRFYGQVKGSVSQDSDVTYSGGYVRMAVKSNGTTFNVVRPNGTLSASVAVGAGNSVGNFSITPGVFEGNFVLIEYHDASGNLVDRLDMNKWDGGLTGFTEAGNPFTITDNAPAGIYIDDWVPIEATGEAIRYHFDDVDQCRYLANLDVAGGDTLKTGNLNPVGIGNNSIRIEFAMKNETVAGVAYGIVLNDTANVNRGLRLDWVAGQFSFQLKNDGDSLYKAGTYTPPNPSDWMRIVIDIEKDTFARLYVNGVLGVNHVNNAGWSPVMTSKLISIASKVAGTGCTLKISNVKITHDGKTFIYPCTETSGTVWEDVSGNGANGTYTDSAPATIHSKGLFPLSFL